MSQQLDYHVPSKPETSGAGVQTATILLCALMLFVMAGVIWKIHGDSPTNHTSIDPRIFHVIPVVGASWAAVTLFIFRSARRWALLTLAMALLLWAFIYVVDHFNLMVQYERWIKRGMPSQWEWTR